MGGGGGGVYRRTTDRGGGAHACACGRTPAGAGITMSKRVVCMAALGAGRWALAHVRTGAGGRLKVNGTCRDCRCEALSDLMRLSQRHAFEDQGTDPGAGCISITGPAHGIPVDTFDQPSRQQICVGRGWHTVHRKPRRSRPHLVQQHPEAEHVHLLVVRQVPEHLGSLQGLGRDTTHGSAGYPEGGTLQPAAKLRWKKAGYDLGRAAAHWFTRAMGFGPCICRAQQLAPVLALPCRQLWPMCHPTAVLRVPPPPPAYHVHAAAGLPREAPHPLEVALIGALRVGDKGWR